MKNFIIIKDNAEDIIYTLTKPSGSATFVAAANVYAFSDCYDESVMMIVVDGKEWKYLGWQPHMVFEFEKVGTGERFIVQRTDWEH